MARLLVNIDVDDIGKAVAFYRDAFALDEGRRLGEDAVEMLGADVPIYLLQKPSGSAIAPGAAEKRDYARHWTPVHLDFVVPDLQTALERACAAGARPERGVQIHAWGRIALLSDPFGNGFCLIEFSGRGYDEIAC